MRLEELYKRHIGEDIYIIGTGASLRLFPLDFFKSRTTIGLNQAYRHLRTDYSITIHPYLIPLEKETWNTQWITKIKETDEAWMIHHIRKNDKKFYIFNNNNNPSNFDYLHPEKRPENSLYVGCGIHTGAMHLAALMGARNIILVGCDFSALEDQAITTQHHAHEQHIEPHQYSMDEMYEEYFFYAVKVRELLIKYYKLNVLNLSGCFGLPKYAYQEFLKANLHPFSTSQVIEKQKRTTPITRSFFY